MRKLTLEEIKEITLGAVRVESDENGVNFHRFTKSQEEIYKNRNADFYKNVFATSGVKLSFKTDTQSLFLKVDVLGGSSRKFFSFDVFVDGEKVDCLKNFSEDALPSDYSTVLLPLGEFEKKFSLKKGEKKVSVYFPYTMKATLKELLVDKGAFIEPIKPKYKLLCFGDSITQGYDALYPSNKYTTQLADFLDAEEYNKAIGGEVFFPELVGEKEDFEPDYVTVAYGTNDWSHL